MSNRSFIGYEYQEISVKNEMSSVCADGYANFGWKLEDSSFALGRPDSVVMKFKRNRKIRNKTELTRLQRQFDSIVSDIISLESSKRLKASIIAYTVGIVGTAFMAGSVFSVTAGLILPCIILAIPAFVGWILPYFLYRSIEKDKTASVAPLIDSKYDELYTICEKANDLLDETK
jgi:hypothetical protein